MQWDTMNAFLSRANVAVPGEHLIIDLAPTKISSLDANQVVNPLVRAAWKLVRRIPGLR